MYYNGGSDYSLGGVVVIGCELLVSAVPAGSCPLLSTTPGSPFRSLSGSASCSGFGSDSGSGSGSGWNACDSAADVLTCFIGSEADLL